MYTFIAASALVSLVSLVSAFVAVRAADAALAQGRKLVTARADIIQLGAHLAALESRHRKLEGKYYGTLGRLGPAQREAMAAAPFVDAGGHPLPAVCENWAIGQKTGPKSDAAACQCDYCASMRELRHNVKAHLVPKSQAQRIESMRRGLAQPE